MPLKQATPSGRGWRSRRAAGPPPSGEKKPSSVSSIDVRRSTTSSTLRSAGGPARLPARVGGDAADALGQRSHGWGPGAHGLTLTRLGPRDPSQGPGPAAGFRASGVQAEEGGSPDALQSAEAGP